MIYFSVMREALQSQFPQIWKSWKYTLDANGVFVSADATASPKPAGTVFCVTYSRTLGGWVIDDVPSRMTIRAYPTLGMARALWALLVEDPKARDLAFLELAFSVK